MYSSTQQLKQPYHPLFEHMHHKVLKGKFYLIGRLWVENDVNTPSGKALSHASSSSTNIQRYFELCFGHRSCTAWLPDSFGLTGALPQVIRGVGMDYLFMQKLSWWAQAFFFSLNWQLNRLNVNVFPDWWHPGLVSYDARWYISPPPLSVSVYSCPCARHVQHTMHCRWYQESSHKPQGKFLLPPASITNVWLSQNLKSSLASLLILKTVVVVAVHWQRCWRVCVSFIFPPEMLVLYVSWIALSPLWNGKHFPRVAGHAYGPCCYPFTPDFPGVTVFHGHVDFLSSFLSHSHFCHIVSFYHIVFLSHRIDISFFETIISVIIMCIGSDTVLSWKYQFSISLLSQNYYYYICIINKEQ